MNVVSAIASVVSFVLSVFVIIMWGRFFLDLAANFARNWRPRGPLLVVAELIFSITDPPIRAVRRVVPPLRVGGIALDFAFAIVLIGVFILQYIVSIFRFSAVA